MRPPGTAAHLEARRRRAADLLGEGMSLAEVARHVQADVSSVKRWKRAVRDGGSEALTAKPHPGRPSKLSADEKQQLAAVLRAGPLAAGFRTDLWTTRRVAEVIRKRFGIQYHPDHVGRLMYALGFSRQKPHRRARQRDEEAIERWRREDWPRIKKRAADGKLASSFSMKRASCCSR